VALLQISEPGQSPDPHLRRRAVGIDLGTTNSLVATVRSGTPETLADEQGRHLLPSVIHYGADDILVGTLAKALAPADALNTLASVKRYLGRGVAEVSNLGSEAPYELIAQAGGMPKFRTRRGDISPVEASAEILKALRHRAEAALDALSTALSSPCPRISTTPSAKPPGMPPSWPASRFCDCSVSRPRRR